MSAMPEHTDFLTRKEFAGLLGFHVRTLEKWAAQGIGPEPVRHGPRQIRYRRDEVLAYLRDGEKEGSRPVPAY